MSEKDLSQLTPEELMALAKNPIKAKKQKNLSPIKEFIISEDISAGTEKIAGVLVYDRYTTWCKAMSIKPFTMTKFFTEFVHYFEKKRSTSGVAYMLNPKGFDLAPEKLRKLNAEYQKRISRNVNKKKNKKEDHEEKS